MTSVLGQRQGQERGSNNGISKNKKQKLTQAQECVGTGNECIRSYIGGVHQAYKTECDSLQAQDCQGMALVGGGDDGKLRLWDFATGELRHIISHPLPAKSEATVGGALARSEHICSVNSHPDKPLVLSSSHTGCIALWNISSTSSTQPQRRD